MNLRRHAPRQLLRSLLLRGCCVAVGLGMSMAMAAPAAEARFEPWKTSADPVAKLWQRVSSGALKGATNDFILRLVLSFAFGGIALARRNIACTTRRPSSSTRRPALRTRVVVYVRRSIPTERLPNSSIRRARISAG